MSTGSVMYYIMSVSEPLGELDYIYVWHDNSGGGSNASWYLARIDIEDIQKKERFFLFLENFTRVCLYSLLFIHHCLLVYNLVHT